MLQESTTGNAIFDSTGIYRYSLQRWWANGPMMTMIMLNPSQADAQRDDPTLRRSGILARQWGYGRLEVVNLFAYRSADHRRLKQVSDPVGPKNDHYLLGACDRAHTILLAWGNWGSLQNRDQAVLTLLKPYWERCYCLGRNRTGQPRHPLYAPRNCRLYAWTKSSQFLGS